MVQELTVLAFDTALAGCSVAVLYKQECAQRVVKTQRRQASILIPEIQDCLKQVGTKLSDVDVIVTTIGPGSFTGLRIGLSTARGLGLALNIPIVGVTTLEAMAYQYFKENGLKLEQKLLVVLETKRKDFYAQAYDTSGQPISVPVADNAKAVLDLIKKQPCIVIGDAAERFISKLNSKAPNILSLREENNYLDPSFLVYLGLERFHKESSKKAFHTPEPLYLRGADISSPKYSQRLLAK